MKIVRDSAVRQEPAQPQAVSPEENRFSIRPRQIALFFLWMLAFTLLARGTFGALLPEVQLSTPAPNTITQSLTATGTIQWAAGSLFYLPEGLLVEAVFVSEGEAVQEGDKIAALRREDVEQKLRSLQAELAQKQTEYARLTKPVAADSYDLEKAQQALQAAYQAAENSAAAWAEKQANAGSERDALQRELNERQEKAAQYAREIAEKQAQRELLQQEESPDEEIISRIEAELTQLTAEETQNREALAEAEARLNEADAALESVQSQREEAARTAAQAAEQAEQARNDARHAYEKSVEAASETAAANAASATVLAEQIREMESSVETLKKIGRAGGRLLCAADGYRGISAAYAGADQRPGGREHFRPRKRVSDPICAGGRGRGAGYRRRYGDGHAGSKVRKRENQFVRFSAGWRRGAFRCADRVGLAGGKSGTHNPAFRDGI